MMIYKYLFIVLVALQFGSATLFAEDFNLDSPYNKGVLRFEIDNDIVWSMDSNFTNGWSLQYHTVRYDNWDETKAPGFMKWVGNHFPTLDDENSIVRNGHGIGQIMLTPGDLTAEIPQEGDLPYAGSLSYSLSWQSYNRKSIRNFQITAGILGEEALSEEFQKFVHNDLDMADDPKGWDTQRETEPILNFGYQYAHRLAQFGSYTDDWGGQLNIGTLVSLGNLDTGVELGLGLRYGWNILEGFEILPLPPGIGIFQAAYIPKPASASPHSVELVLGISGKGMIYSVVYDGSLITDDDRDVERENFLFSGLFGVTYYYYKYFSISAQFQKKSDFLKEESLPDPPSGQEKTHADLSFGSLIVEFYF